LENNFFRNKKMGKVKHTTINEYILSSVPEAQEIMKEIQKLIETTAPEAVGGISWNVPIYKYNGILAGFDVSKNHVSFGIDSLNDETRNVLGINGYKTGKSTIQIKFNQKVPTKEIVQLIKEQLSVNSKINK
jgi:uncharacterized protein YdhG (YjbR/CyaY superfamily)